MSVKIRLQRHGRKKRPFYHIVVADARSPRDGRFIEKLGTYNPMTKPASIDLDRDVAFDWLMKGAQPTDTVRAMLKLKGVLYRKHLQRGVSKGALDQEKADQLYNDFISSKDAKVAARFEQTSKEKADYHTAVSGKAKAAPVKEEAPAEEVAATDEAVSEETPATEEATPTAEVAEASPAEASPAEETPAKEEAPAVEEAPAEAKAEEEE